MESERTILWLVALAVLVLNIPFGYWRAGVPKFSPRWFVAIHAPVPLVVGMRLAAGIRFHWTTIPILVVSFFGGQFLGGLARRRLRTDYEVVR
jgi:hypothetical protein